MPLTGKDMAAFPNYAVLDAGVATEIIDAHGYDAIFSDPLWGARQISTDPTAVQTVHKRFLEAGSDIIETATYLATVPGFKEHLGLSPQEGLELVKTGVRLAQQVRDEFWKDNKHPNRMRPLVAGAVGPYGAHLWNLSEFHGKYVDSMSLEELVEWHRPVVQALLEAGVEILALETIPAQKEAEALIQLLKEFPDARAWMTFSCKDGQHTSHGEKLADVLKLTIPSQQVVATGINCTSPLYIESLLKSVPEEVRSCKKLVAYPNSGETWAMDDGKAHAISARGPEIAPLVRQWLDSGANWIGSCCGTKSSDIASIRKEMNSRLEK